jgi:GntR family transcriptional regulator
MAATVLDQWQVEYNSGIPVYRQIINQTCAAVAAGAFRPGGQLPTIRALSERLNVNPNTVAKAYHELELKGVIANERGRGSFIQVHPADLTPDVQEKKAQFQNLYQRLLADAASVGLTERELLGFIKEINPATL